MSLEGSVVFKKLAVNTVDSQSSSSSEDTISFSDTAELLKLMERMVLGGEDDSLRDGVALPHINGTTDGPDSDELVPAEESTD